MSSRKLPTYEVIVLVKDNPEKVSPEYNSFHGIRRNWEERKMKHIDATCHKQAALKAKKYGKVESVRVHHPTRCYERFDSFKLDQAPQGKPNINTNISAAIAMDEFIWKKRNIRRSNMQRDKNKY